MNSSRQCALGNFAMLTITNVAGRLVSMVSGIYTRRVFGVVAIGQLSWAQAVLSYFSLMINPVWRPSQSATWHVTRNAGRDMCHCC